MKPEIPPQAVRVICGIPLQQQADRCGITRRNLDRLVKVPWEKWRVDTAVRWCEACGLSFWNLKFTPEIIRRVRWGETDEHVVSALRAIHEIRNPTAPPLTRRQLIEIGRKAMEEFGCGNQA